jgi:hypothetical protein
VQIECYVFAVTPSRDDWKKKDRAALSTRAHQYFCRRGQPYIGVNSPLLH